MAGLQGRQLRVVFAASVVVAALHLASFGLPHLFALQVATTRRLECSTTCRRAISAWVDPAFDSDLNELKEQLRHAPTQAAVTALERLWLPGRTPTLSQLQGEWQLRGPKGSSSRKDLPRLILNLYKGGVGKILNMDIISEPKIKIARDGQTETQIQLRWGAYLDEVTVLSGLEMVAPGRMRERRARAVRSRALPLTLPLVQPLRNIRVTYFDGDLLVLRDEDGAVDVLWRQGVRTRRATRGESSTANAEPESILAAAKVATNEDTQLPPNRIDNLLASIDDLKESLMYQREQAADARAERKRLMVEAGLVEELLDAARVDVSAQKMRLEAVDTVVSHASKALERHKEKTGAETLRRRTLQSQLTQLEGRAVEFDEKISRLSAHLASLRSQLPMLEQELKVGPRDTWPGLRSAISVARKEVGMARNELRQAERELASVKRDIGKTSAQLEKQTVKSKAEAEAEGQLEKQLMERRRELSEQEEALPTKAAVEQELHSKLDILSSELQKLEAHESERLMKAGEIEGEVAQLASQVKEVKKVAKNVKAKFSRVRAPWR